MAAFGISTVLGGLQPQTGKLRQAATCDTPPTFATGFECWGGVGRPPAALLPTAGPPRCLHPPPPPPPPLCVGSAAPACILQLRPHCRRNPWGPQVGAAPPRQGRGARIFGGGGHHRYPPPSRVSPTGQTAEPPGGCGPPIGLRGVGGGGGGGGVRFLGGGATISVPLTPPIVFLSHRAQPELRVL